MVQGRADGLVRSCTLCFGLDEAGACYCTATPCLLRADYGYCVCCVPLQDFFPDYQDDSLELMLK